MFRNNLQLPVYHLQTFLAVQNVLRLPIQIRHFEIIYRNTISKVYFFSVGFQTTVFMALFR